MNVNETVVTLDVDGSSMEVFRFSPEGDGPFPALILAQHIPVGHTGIENDEFTLVTARRYAAAGYEVAVPFIFHWWPKDGEMMDKAKESRDHLTVADLTATHTLLASDDRVNPEKIGIAGHCWGGRVAWIGACHLPLAACIVFYGGRIKLPFGDGTPPIEMADRIQCPVAGFFGNDDANPTPEDVDDYEVALVAAGITPEFHRYDGAGHAFQNFPTPERYREAQSEDAWAKALDFLARSL